MTASTSAFHLSVECKGSYLYFKGEGIRESVADIIEGTRKISAEIEASKIYRILVDYSNVITRVSYADIFNIVRIYDSHAPLVKTTVAAVINPGDVANEKFWEDMCIRRGYKFRIFVDLGEATAWIERTEPG